MGVREEFEGGQVTPLPGVSSRSSIRDEYDSYISSGEFKQYSEEEDRKRRKKAQEEAAKALLEQRKREGMQQREDGGFDFFDPDSGEKTTIDSYAKKKNIDRSNLVRILADRGDPASQREIRKQQEAAPKAQQPDFAAPFRQAGVSPIAQQSALDAKRLQDEQVKKAQEEAELKQSRIEVAKFLDNEYQTEQGTITGRDIPLKSIKDKDGKPRTYGDILDEYNSKSRLDQDNYLADLQKTIDNNQLDFGDENAIASRDEAQLLRLLIEQRGEKKNEDLASVAGGVVREAGGALVKGVTDTAQNLTSSARSTFAGVDELKLIEDAFNEGKISKEEFIKQTNETQNRLGAFTGGSEDRGVLDRVLRSAGAAADVATLFIPVGAGVSASKTLAKGGVIELLKSGGRDAAIGAAIGATGSLREGTDVTAESVAINAGLGALLSGAGTASYAGIKKIVDKVKSGKQLTPDEIAELEVEAQRQATAKPDETEGDQIIKQLDEATDDGDAIVQELNGSTVKSEGDAIVEELNQSTPVKPMETDGDSIIDELTKAEPVQPVETSRPKGSVKPLGKKTETKPDQSVVKPTSEIPTAKPVRTAPYKTEQPGRGDEIVATPVEQVKPPVVGDTVSGNAARIERLAVEKKLTDNFGDLPQYKAINMKEQAKQALELISRDRQQALDIIDGRRNPSGNLKAQSVHQALEEVAIREGDVDLLRKLANSNINTELSESAQNLRIAAERDPHSAVENIRQVRDARRKAAEKRSGTTVSKEVANIRKIVKQRTPVASRQTWASFVKELEC